MPADDRTRVDDLCLTFLHELTELLTAIACEVGAARRLCASHDILGKIADSLEQISLEMTRIIYVINRFRSYLRKEAKQQLDNIEETGGPS